MNISESLTQRQLLEILMNIYERGNETENIRIQDIVDDIKQQILEHEFPVKAVV